MSFFITIFFLIETEIDQNTFYSSGVDAEKQKELNKVVREILTCDICGRSVHGKFNLKRHLKEQHIEPARCKACERLFRGKYSLKRHEKEQHSTR